MLDGGSHYGNLIPVTTTPGSISISGSCAAGASSPASGPTAAPGDTSAPGASPIDAGTAAPSDVPTDTGLEGTVGPLESGAVAVLPGESAAATGPPASLAASDASGGGSPVIAIGLIAVVTVVSAVLSFAWYRRRFVGAR
jgi:hypothetical protein